LRALQPITFTYGKKHYSGRVISSLQQKPYLHWLLFEHPELINLTGEDSACFKEDATGLACMNRVLMITHPQLVETAKKIIENYLAERR
jgi:hypothetical protein